MQIRFKMIQKISMKEAMDSSEEQSEEFLRMIEISAGD